ncbi:MAG: hypothetical protein GC154_06480 [bacterium]|nr:hypothetical protein [bacterium]
MTGAIRRFSLNNESIMNESPKTGKPYSIWLTLLNLELAAVCFFIPAGRFQVDLGFYRFTTGHDAYKMFPLLFLTWFFWRRGERKPWAEARCLEPLVFLLVCSILGGAASIDGYQALTESLELLCYVLFYLILCDLPWGRLHVGWLGGAFVAGNFYLCGKAVQQWLLSGGGDGLPRIHAAFDHPNQLGAYAVLGVPLLAWLASRSRAKWQSILTGAATAGVCGAALLSMSRAACLGLAVCGVVYFVWGDSAQRRVCLAFAGLAALGMIATLPWVGPRFMELFSGASATGGDSRLFIWSGLLDSTAHALPYFGEGMGPILQDRLNNWIATAPETHLPLSQWGPHSLYLALLLSSGLPGLFALIWLAWIAGGLIRRCPPVERAALAAGGLGLMTHQLFMFSITQGNLFLAMLGLIFIAEHRAEREGSS